MERRKDYRHQANYLVSIKCPRTRRVVDGVVTERVSASGLSFAADGPHGFRTGDKVELQLVANVRGHAFDDVLVMATTGTVLRADEKKGALRFDGPLAY
jgi:hypothetical protein